MPWSQGVIRAQRKHQYRVIQLTKHNRVRGWMRDVAANNSQFRCSIGGTTSDAIVTVPPTVPTIGQLVQAPLRNCQCNSSLCAPTAKTSTDNSPDRTARGRDMTTPPETAIRSRHYSLQQ